MTTNKEKRKRTSDDGVLDFLPLSKRINNLHIDNKNLSISNSNSYCSAAGSAVSSPIQDNNNTSTLNHNDISLNVASCDRINDLSLNIPNSGEKDPAEFMALANYNPDLSSIENPYYYVKNKLLYDLYVERMRRCAYHP